jgi:hypothetical protein
LLLGEELEEGRLLVVKGAPEGSQEFHAMPSLGGREGGREGGTRRQRKRGYSPFHHKAMVVGGLAWLASSYAEELGRRCCQLPNGGDGMRVVCSLGRCCQGPEQMPRSSSRPDKVHNYFRPHALILRLPCHCKYIGMHVGCQWYFSVARCL